VNAARAARFAIAIALAVPATAHAQLIGFTNYDACGCDAGTGAFATGWSRR
jgi:hypothetical protein